jgi:hypothetical protein
MNPETIQALVTGAVSGLAAAFFAVRATFRKLDTVDDLEKRVVLLEADQKALKARADAQEGEMASSLKALTETVNKMATDIAYLKGRFEGEDAAMAKAARLR